MSSQVSASTSPMRAPVASSTSKMRSRSYPRAGPRFDRPLCHAAILRRISTASSGVGARGLVADRGGVYAGVDGGVAERRYRSTRCVVSSRSRTIRRAGMSSLPITPA